MALALGCDPAGPPVPTTITAVNGEVRTGRVGAPLEDPLTVVVTDAEGSGLGGVAVSWSVAVGTGSVDPSRARTDEAGRASTRWILGEEPGEQEVAAAYPGSDPVIFIAEALPGPAASVVIAPDSVRLFAAGDTVRLSAQVKDAFDNRIAAPEIVWSVSDSAVAEIDGQGLVTAVEPGRVRVIARVDQARAPADTATVVVRPATPTLTIAPGRITALTGDTVAVSVVDEIGEPVDPARLTWGTSDPAVAGIDPATSRVLARGAGSATITAATDGAADTLAVMIHTGSGVRVPELAHYDSIIPAFMKENGLVGGAVAVARGGRLLLARGYGRTDSVTGAAVKPSSLFRIASVSKSIAAVVGMRLMEQGRLHGDDVVFDLLRGLAPDPLPDVDPRLAAVTVHDLLTHSGGWDMDATFDPAFASREVAWRLGLSPPASARDVVRYMWGEPLQFDPGTAFAYSNFGYILLARVIEGVAGLAYEDAVRDVLLAPAGLDMRLGRTLPEDRFSNEVAYYGEGSSASVFPPHDPVPPPDGAFYLEAMDGSSGWVASAVELARFLSVVDDDDGLPDLLEPATMDTMLARPPLPDWTGTGSYYGRGWWVQPYESGRSWWSEGSLPGSSAVIVRSHSGVVWAAVFNGSVPPGSLNTVLWTAFGRTRDWPDHDLFDRYP